MDTKSQSSQSVSDDQELAKVLAGVTDDDTLGAVQGSVTMPSLTPPGLPPISALSPADISTTLPDGSNSQEMPITGVPPTPLMPEMEIAAPPSPSQMTPDPIAMAPSVVNTPESSMPSFETTPTPTLQVGGASSELDGIKQEALSELRPLVGKLNLEPAEKFDTYLLLIRSTDDKTLIAPAYEAAKAIPDETKRAEALLDVVKEIDFLSQHVA